jgi:hypothetical protein
VFRSLELGERVERAGAKDLPLELAVALLADAEGRITLDIPVRGNLNDPRFDFGGLVARAVGNAIGKVVSAPFRALARLFDDGTAEDLAEVRFAPGSAELTPPQEENVSRVAQALAARPRLQVSVRPGYDPQSDAAALQREAARREIARAAGYESAGPLDFTDPKTLHAAENLYLDRVGNRLELQALRKREQRYGPALVSALAGTVQAQPDAARALAGERAQAVRAALLEEGVPAARVALREPIAGKTADGAVSTRFVLEPAKPPGSKGSRVAQAQRALEAAGFDPGPLDGVLGPRTEAALRRFQEAQGLPVSGELDRVTGAALEGEGERAAAGSTR